MESGKRILIVDDEADILDFLQYNLNKEGYQTETAQNGKQAIERAKVFKPDLILLDIMMPEMDGMETCRKLRSLAEFKETLIAFLTARNEDYSQISGFEAGADDYISKPIKPKVLLSRIKGLLRRAGIDDGSKKIIAGEIEIDPERYVAVKNNKIIELPRKEFELLFLLASKPGKVFSRREILNRIWGDEIIVGDRTIDVHIRKVREKIGEDHIKTLKGVGYKFDL